MIYLLIYLASIIFNFLFFALMNRILKEGHYLRTSREGLFLVFLPIAIIIFLLIGLAEYTRDTEEFPRIEKFLKWFEGN